MPVKVDILESDRWFTNTDYAINCYVKQADGTTAQDITGWTLSWILKKHASEADADALLLKTTAGSPGGDIAIIDAVAGYVQVVIFDTDTDGTVRPGVYVHELKRTDEGFEAVLIQGMAVLRRSAHVS